MESGPVPPHERTWRHPSEVAAEERQQAMLETMSPSARALALTWGTIGAVSVGLLVLTVAPDRSEFGSVPGGAESALVAVTQAALAPLGPAAVEAIATPIRLAGTAVPSRLAVVTAVDVADGPDGRSAARTADRARTTGLVSGSPIEVAVPSGRTHRALVIGHLGDTVVVRLEHEEPGLTVRSDPPRADETVTVLASPPMSIALGELDTIDVAEGTAVVDGSGALIGLCTRGERAEVRLVTVGDRSINSGLVDATNDG